jgi:plasmid stabilization system protein ParE
MAEVRLAGTAYRQLRTIRRQRFELAGLEAAERLGNRFQDLIATLETFPRVGVVFHQTQDAEFRRFPVEQYVVSFRVKPDDAVLIVDVRPGRMRPPPLDRIENPSE